MLKRILSILTVAAVLLSFAACMIGGGEESPSAGVSDEQTSGVGEEQKINTEETTDGASAKAQPQSPADNQQTESPDTDPHDAS